MPAIQTVNPDEAVILGLLLELALAVDSPAYKPAGVAAGYNTAGDNLAGQRITMADFLNALENVLVCSVNSPGFPACCFDILEEFLGTAESRILCSELLPQFDGGTFAVLDSDNGSVGLVAVCGAVALAAVGADNQVIFGEVNGMLYAALLVDNLLCNLFLGSAVT